MLCHRYKYEANDGEIAPAYDHGFIEFAPVVQGEDSNRGGRSGRGLQGAMLANPRLAHMQMMKRIQDVPAKCSTLIFGRSMFHAGS
jgi:hypothetical protein